MYPGLVPRRGARRAGILRARIYFIHSLPSPHPSLFCVRAITLRALFGPRASASVLFVEHEASAGRVVSVGPSSGLGKCGREEKAANVPQNA